MGGESSGKLLANTTAENHKGIKANRVRWCHNIFLSANRSGIAVVNPLSWLSLMVRYTKTPIAAKAMNMVIRLAGKGGVISNSPP